MKTIHTDAKPVWLTTPEEFAAAEVGQWVTVPENMAAAMLGRGVRKQVTHQVAMAQHRTHIETALQLDFPVAVASIQFHGFELPEGYEQEGELFVKRKRRAKNALRRSKAGTK